LVVHGRVSFEVADQDAVLVDHPDIEVRRDDQHALASVLSSRPDIVELGSIAKRVAG
jgi:hypothetical protein